MRGSRHRAEATHIGHLREGGLQPAQRLHVSVGADGLIAVEDGEAIHIRDRNDGAGEATLAPGLRGALVRAHGIGIHIIAREAVFRGDQIRRHALRHEIGVDGDRGIHADAKARRAHADAAHGLDTAADRHLLLAGHDLGCGKVHRIKARGAEAVDLHARHLRAIASLERHGAGDIGRGLAHRIDAAEDNILDEARLQPVAAFQRLQRLRAKLDGRDLMERAIGLALSARVCGRDHR